jgi:membrane protease subunit HflC
MKIFSGFAVVVILGAVLLAGDCFYTVNEAQQVIITQFGKPVGEPVREPGLHMKLPFIQDVNAFDKRFLEWDGDPNQITTKDKRFIWVDSYARWRIKDPLLFFKRLRDETRAQSRLDDILDGGTRNVVAKFDLIELVESPVAPDNITDSVTAADDSRHFVHASIKFGRGELAHKVIQYAVPKLEDLGIELLDFQFKRINYVEQVRKEVYARMISERKRIAEQYRAEGAGEAARIEGEKKRQLKTISSEAYRKAKEIKGRADANVTAIYAAAFGQDPEFYKFIKGLETLKAAVDKNTTLVLSTDGEVFRMLHGAQQSETP